MHAFVYENGGEKVHIHHNGDFSGNACVCFKDDRGQQMEFWVPCQALVNFSRNATLGLVIAEVENLYVEG